MANSEHLAILRQGVAAWNAWRRKNWKERPDLSEADLGGSDLHDADLINMDLRRANLVQAKLIRANLSWADLGGADVSGADLSAANFRGANVNGANASSALLQSTIWGDMDLSRAIGLESCLHFGPSIIDFQTLAKSRNLPLVFLRGCGLPDKLIEYLPSLLDQPIQFYSCFISYSTLEPEFADRLYADLQNKGVRCWFAPHNVQSGKKLHEQIDEAIRIYDRLLLILSPHSMNSEWVRTEIATARKRERSENRRMLFPVGLVNFQTLRDWECFDADAGKDSAREIREYYIPDFSNWKDHDEYQREFEKLLRDLKNELSPP